jgi:hypothetical protein
MHSPPDEQSERQPHAEEGPSPVHPDGQKETPEAPVETAPSVGVASGAQTSEQPRSESSEQGQTTPSPTGALPPDPPDYKAVARISTQAVLEHIKLAFLHADVLRGVEMPEDWTKIARTTSNASAEFNRDALRLVVYCGFVTVWAPDLQEEDGPALRPKDAPFELHARFQLEYSIKDLTGIEQGDEEYFAWTNGMLHAWPYWREIAQSMTLRMGLVPLVVGTFKIPWSGDPGRGEKKAVVAEERSEGQAGREEATSVEGQVGDEQTSDE